MVFPPARVAAAAAAITGTVFPHYNHTDPTGALASLQGVARVGTGTAAATTAAASAVAGAATNTELQTAFPASSGSSGIAAVSTIAAGESFDGGMYLWDRSDNTCEGQTEGGDSDALFILEEGATLSNVIVGPDNGEGIHCKGSCTLNNIWWTQVCEDAATFKQESGTSYVNGGGARTADDKVLQHNGGGTLAVKNFWAQDVGKVYRSCGNCVTQYARTSTFDGLYIDGADVVAGINGNEGDTTTISNSCIMSSDICWLFEGTDDNDVEPSKTASAPDGSTCATSAVSASC